MRAPMRTVTARASASVSVCMPSRKENDRAACFERSSCSCGAQDLTLDETAIALLERMKARERGGKRKLIGVARVNACYERLDCIIEQLGSQPPNHELRHRFLFCGRRSRNEGLAREPELGAQRKSGVVRKAGGEVGSARSMPSRTT